MQVHDGRLVFSATDLSLFLACPHLSLLSRRAALGGPKPPVYDDPGVDVLRERGKEHERGVLVDLTTESAGGIATIEDDSTYESQPLRYEALAAATLEAMAAGTEVIYQGCLFDGAWLGYPDFLIKVARPSRWGNWSYEVLDAKLAREAKGGALLQVLLYSALLEKVQGVQPEQVRLALGGPKARRESFLVNDYAAYFRSVRTRFLDWVTNAPEDVGQAPEPAPHCEICAWETVCDRERRHVDHLCFVAGISRQQRSSLHAAGISTLEGLATLVPETAGKVEGIRRTSLERIQNQARIQHEGRTRKKPIYELLEPVVQDRGLAAMPAPSPGDLFFDIEGDPYALGEGLEYLFGVADTTDNYTPRWGLDRTSERQMFEWFIDLVIYRLADHPDLHVYHYAAYEPTALKRLAGRYDTRIEELDSLLRGKVFVDLYRVVHQGLRASVESYSIKRLEPFYGFARQVNLRRASAALASFEAWLELGGTEENGKELLQEIQGYNRDDCISTLRLRDWLEGLRDELKAQTGEDVPRPTPGSPEPEPEQAERLEHVRAVREKLTDGLPQDRGTWTPEQQAKWLLAQLLEFHRREAKAMWWRYFNWREMTVDELIEDSSALGGLEYQGVVGHVARSSIHRYRFPPQDHCFRTGDGAHDPATGAGAGSIVAVDDSARTIDLKRAKNSQAPHPTALIPFEHIGDGVLRDSLLGAGEFVAAEGLNRQRPYGAACDFLAAHTPRLLASHQGRDLLEEGETASSAAVRLVQLLDNSLLPIQGPPGAGKTHTGALMILAALSEGKRVGITAMSHRVIGNLLDKVCALAHQREISVRGIQKADEEQQCTSTDIEGTGDNRRICEALQTGEKMLAAGTAWLWSRPEMQASVDLLFIDEAGQFSIANALAVAPAAANLVLLGDPRQLQQPQQGIHPPGTDGSALEHLLQGNATMPPDRGLFLNETWRLHPDICSFTSEIFYQGRLRSRPGLENQCVWGQLPLDKTGLRLLPVAHAERQNECPEEVELVASLVSALIADGYAWTNQEGVRKQLGLDDVLVVAPYNAQVSALIEALPNGARVGTVDKFQGQEAPIVIYSTATSSAEDAPRGMGFLYSGNRLNVATSRARCIALIVAGTRIFAPDCRTPEQMRLANAFCRFRELAIEGM